MNYNEEFWNAIDLFFVDLKNDIENQVNLFGSELEMISKMGSTWFTVPIPDKLIELLDKFNFMGIDDVDTSKYHIDDLELLNVKSKFLKELKSVESLEDKRFLVLFHIKNSSSNDLAIKIKQLLKSLCIFPTLDEMLYATDNLMGKRL